MVCTCPSDVCTCKWKGGKQSVECGDKFLTDLPEGIDPGTQVLNFTGNNLQYLMSERFFKMGLINLQKIFLPRNQLSRINDRAFRGLSNLVELDLSENILTAIPSETFSDYTSLMRLILNGNPIRELKSNAFKHLSFLTTLELSNCQLSHVEDEAFLGLDNLEWLKLDGNLISKIVGHHILPQSLHGIDMQDNRWNCDCKLIDLHLWLNAYQVPHQFEEPKCVYPERLSGQVIKSLKIDALACRPEIAPANLYLELTEGRNTSLLCKISSTPDVQITWLFQGHLLENDTFSTQTMHLYYYIEEGIDDKHSELFIFNVNSDVNGTFSCVAENSAGKFIANYTIHVLVKEEPIAKEINFAYEYVVVIIVGAGVAAFIVALICCCIVLKCKRKTKRNRKYKNGMGQDPNMQLQSKQIKYSASKSTVPPLCPILKNGNHSNNQHKEMQLTIGPNASLLTHQHQHQHLNEIASMAGSRCCSPPSIRNYQDQNPDLINDAESVKSRTHVDIDDASSEHTSIGPCSIGSHDNNHCENGYHPSEKMLRNAAIKYNTLTSPQGINKDLYQHQVDVHLSPGCFLQQKSYPIGCYDYPGIPSVMQPHLLTQSNNQVNYYRTLPHKPKAKLAQNPSVRFSLEAEFLNQGSTSAFDRYNLRKDIRYTAEGYPKAQSIETTTTTIGATANQQFPSPPEGYKNDSSIQPIVGILNNSSIICTLATGMPPQSLPHQTKQWPPTLPGYNFTKIDPIINASDPCIISTIEQKRSFSSSGLSLSAVPSAKPKLKQNNSSLEKDVIHEQNEDELEEDDELCTKYNSDKLRQLTGPFADSPDEGYVGDVAHDAPPDT